MNEELYTTMGVMNSSGFLEGIFAFLMGFILIFLFALLIGYIISSIMYMRLAEKAGLDNKYLAWIPPYGPNILVLKMSGQSTLLVLFPLLMSLSLILFSDSTFITAVCLLGQLVWVIFMDMKLLEIFGKSKYLALFHLCGLSIVVLIIKLVIAFGQAEYKGNSSGSTYY